jgi:hypothetical protein
MPRQIVIEVNFGTQKPDFRRVFDFNDALYRLARGDKWMSFPLDQIDKTTGQQVAVKSARRLRRVSARVQKLMAGIARMTVMVPRN